MGEHKAWKAEIYNPLNYICSYGALSSLGKHAGTAGKKAFIIGTPKSFAAAGEKIHKELAKEGISCETRVFAGYPTPGKAAEYADEVKHTGSDFIIAAGGGRVMDVSKCAASLSEVGIITVPTISATNASYRRNSMIYTDRGQYIKRILNKESPVCVIADAEILGKQPVRYVKAGIIDTMARWYESRPYLNIYRSSLHVRFSSRLMGDIYEYFTEDPEGILDAFRLRQPSETVIETVTNIIGVCGIAANYESDAVLQGFAHPFYNQVTRVGSSHTLLHGEIIGYGILVQLLLEHVSSSIFREETEKLRKYGFAYSLSDIGIRTEEELDRLVSRLWTENIPSVRFLKDIDGPDEIKEAILKVNDIGSNAENREGK